MSLRKSPTLTPALLAANRRNAQKSTGPRTLRGKAQSRMNSLRTGGCSPFHRKFLQLMLRAPPCSVDHTAQAVLTPEQANHPVFREALDMFRRAESEVVFHCIYEPKRIAAKMKKKRPKTRKRSLNVIENTYGDFGLSKMLLKLRQLDGSPRCT